MKWTYDICKEIAKKYNFRSDFKYNDTCAYDKCIRKGWLEDVCSHMEYKTNHKPIGYWTKEKCQEIALKYKSRTDFQKNSNQAYTHSMENGWLNDVCSRMEYKHKPNRYWTKERCQEIAFKYKTRGDFKKFDNSVYAISLNNKWLNDICSHMEYKNSYWDYEKCKKESLKYQTKTKFQKNSRGAYEFSRKNGFLNEICSHMKITGNKYFRCIYVFEFDNNHAYVGLTYNLNVRKLGHLRKGSVYKYMKNSNSKYILKQLTNYIDIDLAQKLENEYFEKYKNNGWIMLNKLKTGGVGGSEIIWSKEKCKIEALKYKHRNDFRKNSSGAYNSTRLNNWLDELCSHMIVNIKWKNRKKWKNLNQ